MAWIKKGWIFAPDGRQWWNRSHAQLPVVEHTDGGERLRVYYSSRDDKGRSHTSYFETAADNPSEILFVRDEPLLPLGEPGTFDDCGVMGTWALDVDGVKYLYYIGWTVRNTVPYHNSIGLALSEDGGRSFRKYASGPLFSPTPEEPYFTGTACVILDDGVWKNWYLSCTHWAPIKGRMEPFYHIKYAESDDGVHWRREGRVAIDFKNAEEGGIVKASVIRENGVYKMWYAFRNGADYRENPANSYRIGYAESDDGLDWRRLDERVGLDVSENGWDAQMLAYPHVIDSAGQRYLFYNGNGFGRSGIGYAQWVDD